MSIHTAYVILYTITRIELNFFVKPFLSPLMLAASEQNEARMHDI